MWPDMDWFPHVAAYLDDASLCAFAQAQTVVHWNCLNILQRCSAVRRRLAAARSVYNALHAHTGFIVERISDCLASTVLLQTTCLDPLLLHMARVTSIRSRYRHEGWLAEREAVERAGIAPPVLTYRTQIDVDLSSSSESEEPSERTTS